MLASGLVHNDTIIFDGTNYRSWRNCMLSNLRTLCPNIEQFLDVGFSLPMDPKNQSLEDQKNLHLEALVSNEFTLSISSGIHVFVLLTANCWTSHAMWTKLEETYGGSNLHDDFLPLDAVIEELPSTSYQEELPIASTSNCEDITSSSTSSTCVLSQGNDKVSGDTICDDSVVICTNNPSCTNASGVDLLDFNTSCNKVSISSCVDGSCISSRNSLNTCVDDMLDMSCCHEQNISISPSCLLANNVEENEHSMGQDMIMDDDLRRSSSSSPGMYMCLMAKGPKVSPTSSPNNSQDENEKEDGYDPSLLEMAKIYHSLRGNDIARAKFVELIDIINERNEYIEELKYHVNEGGWKLKNLKQELHDEKLSNANATNSISCEASILKENVELKAQLELLTSKYGDLEGYDELLSSYESLLISHDRLKLVHEVSITKVTSCEPRVDISTSSKNDLLSCASPSNSSKHNISTSCDELLSLPCCSTNDASTSSSTCVDTNHVEEINELKAQVTSLKKDLEKSHKGKSTLTNILSVQKSPNDKSGLGFNSNVKNKSKINKKKKGQEQVKNSAKIICFKCKVEGHHVRSCPLKKKHFSEKQQGKIPQGQAIAQPQVGDRQLPKKIQANAPQIDKSKKKRKGSTCCYICREKGHFASSCLNGTSSNPILVVDDYSLRKDKDGNVLAKFIGTQSGVKKRTIWVSKPIVTNLLGPNLLGDQQAKT
jgi:hypothetical protein